MPNQICDAVVVGSGPNGLAAAIVLAQAGYSTTLFEAKDTIGGGLRSKALTLPGFVHDVCSAVHPLGLASPFFSKLPLSKYGLEWIKPPVPLAHPLDDGTAVLLEQSIEATAAGLGRDGKAYSKLMTPLVNSWDDLAGDILGPLHFPNHPLAFMRFGLSAILPAEWVAKTRFSEERARALFAGLAAHSILPLNKWTTSAIALVLGILGHKTGWPMPRGGSQQIAEALAKYFQSLGGQIITDSPVRSIEELPPSRVVLFDVTPRQLLKICGERFPIGYRRRLGNYRYGPGVFKIDWALSQPIPWRAKECLRAGTIHLGGTLQEIAQSEELVWEGKYPEKNFILLAQPSLFDPTRAPPGKQTAWAYCHVPNGSTVDMTLQIESQIEKAAPGFKDCILARSTMTAAELEVYNPNYIGGDITGGVQDIFQLFTRPVARIVPYSTPDPKIFICSSSTPPGGGVHGMCGYHAAEAALKTLKSK